MNNFYNEFADEIALVNYDPWESAYENPENDIKDPCSELFREFLFGGMAVNLQAILTKINTQSMERL